MMKKQKNLPTDRDGKIFENENGQKPAFKKETAVSAQNGGKDLCEKKGAKAGFSVKKTATLALLLCLCSVVGIIESFVTLPLPVPGIKLGLANLVTLFVLYYFDKKCYITIGFLRVVLTALLWGGFGLNFIFSFAGWALSAAAVIMACFINKNSIYGISAIGGCFHQIGQMTVAAIVYAQIGLLYYLPFLIAAGTASGLLTAFLTKQIIVALNRSKNKISA